MNYRCVEIPEPDFDASFTDEMVITAYQDEDDFNPCMPDEYPNVRLSQLEQEIQETTEQAAEAFEAANNAAELAELSRTAASAAITEIAEHETEIENPHPVTTTQEFADTQITPLATEATYTAPVWAYLIGLFTAVPKSVLQHIVMGWTVMQNLAARIYVLENKTLFEITLSEDTTQVDITDLDIGEGIPLKVIISGKDYTGSSALLRINGINTTNYQYHVSTLCSYFVILTYPSRYFNDFTFTLHSGNIIGQSIYSRDNAGTLTGGIIHQSTFDLNISKIQSISIFRVSTYVFTAGTKIRLIKV